MVMDKRNEQLEQLEHLSEIRSLMERSSRFISLSGLSGIAAGTFALIGAAAVYLYFDILPFDEHLVYLSDIVSAKEKWGMDYLTFFFLDAALVFIFAVAGGIFFTTRKAKQKGQKIWDKLTQKLLLNLLIPLAAGGIFCLALMKHGEFGLVAPTTLVFYGLALVNGGKYTLSDIHYLGLSEIGLGLIALFYIGYGLEFWAIGFGVLHIIYGTIMYFKYEK
jgi:hypothetical protein